MSLLSGISGWRLALRLARREAWRAKGRSALVLVMVTFPVVAVVAADVAQATSSVSAVEGLDRRLGTAQARITSLPDVTTAYQLPDPDQASSSEGGRRPATSFASIRRILGGPRPVLEVRPRQAVVRTDAGVLRVDATGVDMASPLAKGLFHLTSGRFPASKDEVAVNAALAQEGFSVGDRLTFADGTAATVVGIAESGGQRTAPTLLGMPALFPGPGREGIRSWLVGGAPVTWDQVRAVNAVGGLVLSRDVVEHPPPTSSLPPQVASALSTGRTQLYTVLALIGVMALLEVVLLAGPAFAVGARRQSRTLALLAANGGTPKQSRRVVLGTAVVLGGVGGLAGLVLGIATAWAILPALQGMSDTWFGPFQLRWPHLVAIAAFGLVSALLAAVVPAWIASRQDVVAVLAGRRGDRKASLRSPLAGLLLLGVGVVLAVLGARQGAGELLIAAAAVVSVFGMIFLVPVVVVTVARLGRRFPLPLRYAVRDAARHRTRTVPAVAAVAATVAGVVALAIANTSDQAQARADYTQELPVGMGAVTAFSPHPDWPALTATVHRIAPESRVRAVVGAGSQHLRLSIPGHSARQATYASVLPSQAVVSDGTDSATLRVVGRGLDAAQLARLGAALRDGRSVFFTDGATSADTAGLSISGHRRLHVPAVYLDVGAGTASEMGVLTPRVARALGVAPRPVGLVLGGVPLTRDQESTLEQSLTALDPSSYVYVERGYQVPGAERVVLWILFGLAGVLMIGGTLTATFLALSDARPDLATLSAVGAAPRTRRGVAAAYALSVGAVGALLGAAVGFIPGIAVTYPLTRGYLPGAPSHYLSIPWPLILGLVVALPLVTALVVGLTARSRLPLVARLD
ncbi:MAG: FtsX-like permease family protein [Nocardioides sp.]